MSDETKQQQEPSSSNGLARQKSLNRMLASAARHRPSATRHRRAKTTDASKPQGLVRRGSLSDMFNRLLLRSRTESNPPPPPPPAFAAQTSSNDHGHRFMRKQTSQTDDFSARMEDYRICKMIGVYITVSPCARDCPSHFYIFRVWSHSCRVCCSAPSGSKTSSYQESELGALGHRGRQSPRGLTQGNPDYDPLSPPTPAAGLAEFCGYVTFVHNNADHVSW